MNKIEGWEALFAEKAPGPSINLKEAVELCRGVDAIEKDVAAKLHPTTLNRAEEFIMDQAGYIQNNVSDSRIVHWKTLASVLDPDFENVTASAAVQPNSAQSQTQAKIEPAMQNLSANALAAAIRAAAKQQTGPSLEGVIIIGAPDSKTAEEEARERARVADEQARAQRVTEEEKRRADDERSARETEKKEKTSAALAPASILVQAPAPESQSWLLMQDKVAANRQTLFDEVEAKQRLENRSLRTRLRRAEVDKEERLAREVEEAQARQARLDADAKERERQAELAARERQRLRDEEKDRRDEKAAFKAREERERTEREDRKREADARFEEEKRQRDFEANKRRAVEEADFEARERQRRLDEDARERARIADEQVRAQRAAEEERRRVDDEREARKKEEKERIDRREKIKERANDPQWAIPDITKDILASDAYQRYRPFIAEVFWRIRSGDSSARSELDLWKRHLEQQASGCEGRDNARAANLLKQMIQALEKESDRADPVCFNAFFVTGRWEEAA